MSRGLQAHPRARLVVAKTSPQLQCLIPGFRARIAVVAPAMVITQLLERSCTLFVPDGQLQGCLVELQSAFSRVAVAGGRRRRR
jgi:hypothetical protein